jgi:naphthoate synthase
VRIAFDRPEVRNAFRPGTVDELYRVLDHARTSPDVGCVLLTGNGPSPKDGGWAFCSGGDQRIRGRSGYQYADDAGAVEPGRAGRLHVLEVQRLIRMMPKVVVCVVPGWAAGGGHSLHVVCDLTLASAEHARFKQTDADVGSFDGGYGSAGLARLVGQRFAREVFFLGRSTPPPRCTPWARSTRSCARRPRAGGGAVGPGGRRQEPDGRSAMLKYAFNAIDDGLVGQQVFAGEATRLAYLTDEAVEGRDAFLEKARARLVALPVRLLSASGAAGRPGRRAAACARRGAGRRPGGRARGPGSGAAALRPDEPLSTTTCARRPDLGLDRRAEGVCSGGALRASASATAGRRQRAVAAGDPRHPRRRPAVLVRSLLAARRRRSARGAVSGGALRGGDRPPDRPRRYCLARPDPAAPPARPRGPGRAAGVRRRPARAAPPRRAAARAGPAPASASSRPTACPRPSGWLLRRRAAGRRAGAGSRDGRITCRARSWRGATGCGRT